MSKKMNRRGFVKNSAIAGTGFWLAGGIAAAPAKASALEGLRFAGVGVGGKGGSDIDQAGQFGDVVAICDVDDNTLGKKGEKFTKAKKYNDFRKMLEEMGTGFDCVGGSVAARPGPRVPGKTLGTFPTANNNFALAA